MLTYSFEKLGKQSLYEYLYKCIRKDILSGELKPGDRLPPKRSFAKHLGISVITVENAYAQLTAEGCIYSLPRKGYYVAKVENPFFSLQEKEPPGKAAAEEKKTAEPEYFVDFSNSQTSIVNFPFSTWAKLMREVLHENQEELLTSSPAGGIAALRQAVAMHLADYRGISVRPEQIIIGAGTEYLYGLLIQLLGFDKIYGLEDPGYDKIGKIYQSYHVNCAYIAMRRNGITTEELEEKHIDVMHISPSHHFPTGVVMPISQRYELLKWASGSENRYVIEDDYDSEFRMKGQPIPALQNIDTLGRVIYMNTFTKTLTSTVRISYMVLPQSLLQLFHEKLSFYSCTVSNFEQYTLARFIQDGYFEKHLNRMRTYYHGKRDYLLNVIRNSPLSQKVTVLREDSGLHFLMKIQMKMSDREFCDRALEKGIKILPISGYYHTGKQAKNHIFIVNYSSVPEEKMEEAVARLNSILCKDENNL